MLWRYALFSCALGMAGLPIYIHAPKYFVEQYEISLATLGLALLLLRSIDFFKIPFWADWLHPPYREALLHCG